MAVDAVQKNSKGDPKIMGKSKRIRSDRAQDVMTSPERYSDIKKGIQVAEEVALRRKEMEKKVQQLSPQSIDVDMLEESARTMLNMGQEGDYVILDTVE